MVSALTNCVHPFKKVKSEVYEKDDDYDGPSEEICFVWCTACKKVLDYYGYPRRIPWCWPMEIKLLARKLTGYKFEVCYQTGIYIPEEPSKSNTTSLGQMIARLRWSNGPMLNNISGVGNGTYFTVKGNK